MKKVIILSVLLVFTAGFAFAEFQIGSNLGWFFERNAYDGWTGRSFQGIDMELNARYFFTQNTGLFAGIGYKTWFLADNNEYLRNMLALGIVPRTRSTLGTKINLSAGLAFRFAPTESFDIHTSFGVFWNPWGTETIRANFLYYGASIPMDIYINPMSGFGFTGNIFFAHNILPNTSLIFGARLEIGMSRTETVEVRSNGIRERSTSSPDFFGLSIGPFIGIMRNFSQQAREQDYQ